MHKRSGTTSSVCSLNLDIYFQLNQNCLTKGQKVMFNLCKRGHIASPALGHCLTTKFECKPHIFPKLQHPKNLKQKKNKFGSTTACCSARPSSNNPCSCETGLCSLALPIRTVQNQLLHGIETNTCSLNVRTHDVKGLMTLDSEKRGASLSLRTYSMRGMSHKLVSAAANSSIPWIWLLLKAQDNSEGQPLGEFGQQAAEHNAEMTWWTGGTVELG